MQVWGSSLSSRASASAAARAGPRGTTRVASPTARASAAPTARAGRRGARARPRPVTRGAGGKGREGGGEGGGGGRVDRVVPRGAIEADGGDGPVLRRAYAHAANLAQRGPSRETLSWSDEARRSPDPAPGVPARGLRQPS